jgi:hypothetical protein
LKTAIGPGVVLQVPPTVIASEAKQSSFIAAKLDCFAALAMTANVAATPLIALFLPSKRR